MTAQARLAAAVARVNAERIARIITIEVMELKTMVGVSTRTGVGLDAEWLTTADDVAIDDVLKHELVHYACGPAGDAIAEVVGDLGQYATDVYRACKATRDRKTYDVAGDAIIGDVIGGLTMERVELDATQVAAFVKHEVPVSILEYVRANETSVIAAQLAEMPEPMPYCKLETLKKVDEILKRPR